ncbi:hypothetical protein F5879DRAFT_459889 [Lentinula edodes]|uniref:uncharacterized protein n=1 Tax=Lentinula edodes TaxID=5353 RepID=UPI001E8DD50B|nr:uncharacterized protein C8R40DRAFT_836388 [Lentinula edodes]KAH7878373.1 hypothetical protein C8R40DRAFT_836388 [Lentinula edodes]KAJ3899974.1 hypothetical protein F5879DRAFT_459889 [Lentinula edodes]
MIIRIWIWLHSTISSFSLLILSVSSCHSSFLTICRVTVYLRMPFAPVTMQCAPVMRNILSLLTFFIMSFVFDPLFSFLFYCPPDSHFILMLRCMTALFANLKMVDSYTTRPLQILSWVWEDLLRESFITCERSLTPR